MSAHKLQSGVSLVEVLVALVVMSIGMLGIAALFIESVKANRSALLRTQAVALVYDMADRIRGNRPGAARYALALGANPPAARNCVAGVNCLSTELADDDINRWVAAVRGPAGMPWNGAAPPQTGIVFIPAASAALPNIYAITITWREPNQDPAEPDYLYTLNIQI